MCTFFDHWMKSDIKDQITKTFIKLSTMPESIFTEDKSALEELVKSVYYGGIKNCRALSINRLRKFQLLQSSSNDMSKIAPSSDAL